jgi:hypothetical protein
MKNWYSFMTMYNVYLKIYLILLAALGPGVHSAFNRNEYQKWGKKNLGIGAWPALRLVNFYYEASHTASLKELEICYDLVQAVGNHLCQMVSVILGQCDGPLQPYSRFSRPEPLLFLSSSSSIVLTRLGGPRSRPTTSQKIC